MRSRTPRCVALGCVMLLILLAGTLRGQSVDTLYVRQYGEWLSVRPFFEKQYNTLQYQSPATGKVQALRANTPLAIGFGFSWRGIGASFSFGIPRIGDRRDAPTRSFDFQYHYYGRLLIGDLFVQWYRGYYSESDKGEVSFDAKLTFRRLGVRLAHPLLGRQFSYEALYNQSAEQRRFAICFPIGVGFYLQDAQRLEGLGHHLRGGHFVAEVYAGCSAAIPLSQGYYMGTEVTLGMSGIINGHTGGESAPHLSAMGRLAVGYTQRYWSLAVVAYAHSLGETTGNNTGLRILSGSAELAFSWRFFRRPKWRIPAPATSLELSPADR